MSHSIRKKIEYVPLWLRSKGRICQTWISWVSKYCSACSELALASFFVLSRVNPTVVYKLFIVISNIIQYLGHPPWNIGWLGTQGGRARCRFLMTWERGFFSMIDDFIILILSSLYLNHIVMYFWFEHQSSTSYRFYKIWP